MIHVHAYSSQRYLDFHTSEAIPDIGARFDKKQFQEMLKLGRVNSITLFSKCHHGWAYHPSEANEMHPGLSFDLLGELSAAGRQTARIGMVRTRPGRQGVRARFWGAVHRHESVPPRLLPPAVQAGEFGRGLFHLLFARPESGTGGRNGTRSRENPYFNRDVFTFCSHQHTPTSFEYGGPGMVESGSGIYIAWNVFEDYATSGSLILKEAVLHALDRLLPDRTLRTNLPAQGVVTLQEQKEENRVVNHLLYASPVRRGNGIEVIEDIVPLCDVRVSLRLSRPVKNVYLAPQMMPLPYKIEGGTVSYTVPKLECHRWLLWNLMEELDGKGISASRRDQPVAGVFFMSKFLAK
jgi:hypothetical protein